MRDFERRSDGRPLSGRFGGEHEVKEDEVSKSVAKSTKVVPKLRMPKQHDVSTVHRPDEKVDVETKRCDFWSKVRL